VHEINELFGGERRWRPHGIPREPLCAAWGLSRRRDFFERASEASMEPDLPRPGFAVLGLLKLRPAIARCVEFAGVVQQGDDACQTCGPDVDKSRPRLKFESAGFVDFARGFQKS
jgi:hypothetical protein